MLGLIIICVAVYLFLGQLLLCWLVSEDAFAYGAEVKGHPLNWAHYLLVVVVWLPVTAVVFVVSFVKWVEGQL
jgi:hypothetical protein